jgi:porin
MIKKRSLLACALLTGSLAAQAATEQQSWLNGDYVFSGPRRDELINKGYDFFTYYNAIVASNVSGGIDQGTAYAQDLYFGVRLNLERLLGIKGTTFTVSGIDRAGSSIQKDVGSIFDPMQLVGGQTIFLYNVQLETTWWDDQLSLKLGRITATDDFAGSPLYGFYLNNSFVGQIRALLLDGVMTSYPFPVWGARLAYTPSSNFKAKIGVYQLTPDMFDPQRNGLDYSFDESGISVFTQLDWLLNWQGKPGHFAIGVNSVSYPMPKFTGTGTQNPFFRYYLQADQQVYAEAPGSEQGLILFLTLAYSPYKDAALVPFQTSLGIQYQGLIPGRNDDRLIFGATYGDLSSKYAEQQRALGNGDPTYEMPLELGYRIQLTKFAYFQPDVQYVIRPGGTGDIPNATIVGAQFGMAF